MSKPTHISTCIDPKTLRCRTGRPLTWSFKKAKALRDAGFGFKAIGDTLGVNWQNVRDAFAIRGFPTARRPRVYD